ncbi:IS110 family transposase [Streptomyces lincolnensis]|uniref:IS110 family transposase n=1 Tax=Streptomyces lincolnensis TaxID=1915 RepID=UPI001E6546D4|nr:IS110 family transposase [Streptomyces lincolnensis]MCD7440992.1 IS110 family transposase [Streptomyces lincolnensis]
MDEARVVEVWVPVLNHAGDVTRFPTEHHFASYTGTAPLDASSGKNTRHRLNTGGTAR